MTRTISIRLTPEREYLLIQAKKRFKAKKYSDVIDLALKTSVKDISDYGLRLKNAIGCIKFQGDENAIDLIRNLRGE